MTPRRRRVVLLGASNLTLAFPLVATGLHAAIGPMELYAAHGHGRSYGMDSTVLFRTLPGIAESSLWTDLGRREAGSEDAPLALVTDVGNDLLYGAPVETILHWVDSCLERLGSVGADVVLTTLPMNSFRRMGPFRYRAFKAIFYPGKGPTWGRMQRLVPELERGLAELAARRSAVALAPQPEWYGLDPIHIRRARRGEAWGRMFSAWRSVETPRPPTRPGTAEALGLWRLRPATRARFGRTSTTAQPCLRLDDGSTISLY